MAERLNLPLINLPALQEINFGDWEGKTADQIDSIQLVQLYAGPGNFSVPNGEPFHNFQQRILKTWQHCLKIHQGKHILIIAHAGVMRVILAYILTVRPIFF